MSKDFGVLHPNAYACTAHVWRRYGAGTAQVWRMYGAGMARVWRRYGAGRPQVCRMFAAGMNNDGILQIFLMYYAIMAAVKVNRHETVSHTGAVHAPYPRRICAIPAPYLRHTSAIHATYMRRHSDVL